MNTMLDQASKGRDNNLNFIRFVAACLVIISHAYPLTKVGGKHDICSIITDGSISLGGVAVSIFFFYGGFLIFKSAERLHDIVPYFKARILRIIPPLAFVTFILVFIVGPLLTTQDPISYFGNKETYRYLLNSVLVLVHNLPGVFENNFYGSTVNGPLWTLPVEFLCYILCFVFYRLGFGKRAKWTILPVFIAYFMTNFFLSQRSPLLARALRPMMLFYMGMIFYCYRDRIKIKFQNAIIGIGILIAGIGLQTVLPIYDFLVIVSFPPILLWLGYGGHKFAKFGMKCEPSYGMYLCAFPIQQSLACYFPAMQPIVNMLITIPLSIAGGRMIYILVERPIRRRVSSK